MTPGSPLAKMLAIAAPLIVASLVYVLIVGPLIEIYADALSRIEAAHDKIGHLRATQARLPLLKSRIEALRSAMPLDRLAAGNSAPEAQGVLQAVIQKLEAESGVEALSSRLAPPAARGAFTTLEIELDFRAAPASLANFMKALDTAKPVLRVQKLTLSVPESGQGPVDDAGQPVLSVRANIAALAGSIYGKEK